MNTAGLIILLLPYCISLRPSTVLYSAATVTDNTDLTQYKLLCAQDKPINSTKYICCGGKVFKNEKDTECCCSQVINTRSNLCCGGRIQSRSDSSSGCCGRTVYQMSTHHCCNGRIIMRLADHSACCGSTAFNTRSHVCCGNDIHPKSKGQCCGDNIYDPRKNICCGKTLHKRTHVYNTTVSLYGERDMSNRHCCGELLKLPNNECCGNRHLYRKENQYCHEENDNKYRLLSKPRHLRGVTTVGYCSGQLYDFRKHTCKNGKVTDNPHDVSTCVEKLMNDTTKSSWAKCCRNIDAVSRVFKINKRTINRHCRIYVQICGNKVELKHSRSYSCCMGSGNTNFYDYRKEICCGGLVFNKDKYTCHYDSTTRKHIVIKSDQKLPRNNNWCGKPGLLSYDTTKQICCHPKMENDVYTTQLLYPNAHIDMNQRMIWQASSYPPYVLSLQGDKHHWTYRCCGQHTYDHLTHMCCGFKVAIKSPNRECCGTQFYDPREQTCCGIHLYGKSVDGSVVRCCGDEVLNADEICHNGLRVVRSTRRAPSGKSTWNNVGHDAITSSLD